MSTVDEELTRRFRRAERPVGEEVLFEGLARRRRRRRTLQRLEAGALAVVVITGTVGGFLALRSAFRSDRTGRTGTPAFSNGGIVFTSFEGRDGEHLFMIDPDGTALRQLTTGTGVLDHLPDFSPDGRRVVFRREADEGIHGLVGLDIETGDVQAITPPSMGVYRPAWSPDGESIAFAGGGPEESGIWTVTPDGSALTRLTDDRFASPDAPQWSPDSSTIAFTANLVDGEGDYGEGWDVYLMERDGSGLRNLTNTPDPGMSESPIGWLPNGNLLIESGPGHIVSGPGQPVQMGRWLEVTTEGDVVRTVLELPMNTEGHYQEPSISPDGRFAVFDSGRGGQQDIWFVELATGDLTRVTRMGAYGADWQPVPVEAEPTPMPSPEPSPSPTVEPEGHDIGLGFNLCEARRLGGIDFLGAGRGGAAWVGFPTRDDGTCPRFGLPGKYAIAADHTGDGIADSWMDLPWKCYVGCSPYDATDLDGNGTEELILASSFSIMDYYVMTVAPNANGRLQIQPILVAEPGHPPAGIDPGEPLRIDAGGDAGYGSQIECEGYPGAPVIVWSSSSGVVESNRPKEVHIVRIQLQSDGLFHVVGASDYTVPADQPSGIESTSPACGVDWHPSV